MRTAFAVWLTGLPASGKSVIAQALVHKLAAHGVDDVAVLESDALRQVLTPRPTYSDDERQTFYQSMAYIGSLLVTHAVPVIFDATANRRAYRAAARAGIERFIEVYVDCPLHLCVARDPKGIYRRAQSGVTSTVPGVQASYEPPEHPDVVVSGSGDTREAAAAIIQALEARGYISRLSIASSS
jgi:adenylylsulfate kinase